MKPIKKFLIIAAGVVVVVLVIVRLVANKNSFNQELKMVSESNTAIPVITDTVKYRQIAGEFSINGSFSPSQEISITSETSGKIVSISLKNGDKVVTGQVLASINNENITSQLELAKFNLDKTEKDMKRYEQLSKGDAATNQQYESTKQEYANAQSVYTTAKIQYENTIIRAPFDGIITKQYIEKGAYLSPGSPVFDLVSINIVKFIAKLTSEEVENVQKGQSIKVSVDVYPGVIFEGIISAIIVKSDLSKRYDVEVAVPNHTANLIKPGMFGSGIFSGQTGEKILTIPRSALTGSIKSPEVFIVKGDSAISCKITAIPLNDKYIAVKQGLKSGDVIVTSGQISLVNGSKIILNN